MIQMRGEDSDKAMKEWATTEIRSASERFYVLMRFLFSSSLGSTAVFLTLLKFDDSRFTTGSVCAMISFFASTVVAMYASIPARLHFAGGQDLYTMYHLFVRRAKVLVVAWSVFWLFAVGVSMFALFKWEPSSSAVTNLPPSGLFARGVCQTAIARSD